MSKTTYTVAVKTSNVFGAGTDANVYAQLIGERSRSRTFHLHKSISHRNKFERNHTDVFFFPDEPFIGNISKIRIWHDNGGIGPGWHLACVEVNDQRAAKSYNFPCDRWLAKDEEDTMIDLTLCCSAVRTKVPQHLRDRSKLNQDDDEEESSDAADPHAITAESDPQVEMYGGYGYGYPYGGYGGYYGGYGGYGYGGYPYGYGYPYGGYGYGYRPYYAGYAPMISYGYGQPYFGRGRSWSWSWSW